MDEIMTERKNRASLVTTGRRYNSVIQAKRSSQSSGNFTWYATEIDLKIEEHNAGESPLRISYDFDGSSWLHNRFTELKIKATRILKLQTKHYTSCVIIRSMNVIRYVCLSALLFTLSIYYHHHYH